MHFSGHRSRLALKSTRGRGGVVDKIWISDIVMKDIPTDAIGFNMYYGGGSPIPEANGPSETRSASVAVNEGLPEMPIRGIELDNIQISARTGLVCADAERIKFANLRITPTTGPTLTISDSRDVMIDNSGAQTASVFLRVEGAKSQNIRIKSSNLSGAAKAVEFEKGATEAAVIRQ